MKFTTREDIEAPIDRVWAAVTDFESFERQALRRGAEVQRLDGQAELATGAAWTIRFPFRGRDRSLDAELITLDQPQMLIIASKSGGLNGGIKAELVELSKNRTRLALEIEMKPQSIGARVLLQTLRLRKAALTQNFKSRVAQFARRLSQTG